MIIGRRDLRPILSRVPPEAQAFVVLDACYSENSVKAAGVLAAAPVRGVNLAARLRDRDPQAGPAPAATGAAPASESEPYPYSNVVAFAAASKNQAALDIGSQLLSQNWRTVDGKPHGALTNSLLAAQAPRDWAEWACTATACPEFGSDDPRMGRLLQMLRTGYGTAETSLRVITQQ